MIEYTHSAHTPYLAGEICSMSIYIYIYIYAHWLPLVSSQQSFWQLIWWNGAIWETCLFLDILLIGDTPYAMWNWFELLSRFPTLNLFSVVIVGSQMLMNRVQNVEGICPLNWKNTIQEKKTEKLSKSFSMLLTRCSPLAWSVQPKNVCEKYSILISNIHYMNKYWSTWRIYMRVTTP